MNKHAHLILLVMNDYHIENLSLLNTCTFSDKGKKDLIDMIKRTDEALKWLKEQAQ